MTASVYLAAVLEKLAREIIKISGEVAKTKHKVRITEKFIDDSIRENSDASKVDTLLCQ